MVPRRRHALAAAALLGITVCVAGACDNSSPAAGGRTAPAVPDTPVDGPAAVSSAANAASSSQCSVSPSAVVGKALGLPVGKVIPSVEGPVTVCAYAGRYEVLVRYQTGESATSFAQARSSQASLHQSVTTVSGLGDGAYAARYTAGKPASNTLAAREGDIAVFITSPASIGAERALMTALLAKM
jgi:hypothetical protein